jgi:hypothetical protein
MMPDVVAGLEHIDDLASQEPKTLPIPELMDRTYSLRRADEWKQILSQYFPGKVALFYWHGVLDIVDSVKIARTKKREDYNIQTPLFIMHLDPQPEGPIDWDYKPLEPGENIRI